MEEVVDKEFFNGISVLAIADYDAIDTYCEELFRYVNSKGIQIIPIIEISTKTKKCGIHILGYNFDLYNEKFLKIIKLLQNVGHDYLYCVSSKLEELGYVVHTLDLDKMNSVTKVHIA